MKAVKFRLQPVLEQIQFGMEAMKLARGTERVGRRNLDAERRAARHFERAAELLRKREEGAPHV